MQEMAPTQKLAPGTRTKAGSTPANRGGAPSSALVPPRPAQLPVQENMTSEEAQQMANELALSYVRFHRAEDEDEERAIKDNAAVNAALRAAPKASALSQLAVSLRLCCCAYGGPAAPLLASIASGAVAPLKASWLITLKGRGGRLMPRKDLPPEAFFSEAELRRLVLSMSASDCGRLFVAVSCPCLSREHADPDGFNLALVASIAKLYLGWSGYFSKAPADKSPLAMAYRRAGLDERTADCAIMWPFASLHPERVESGGRRAAATWYADPHAVKWIVDDVPARFGPGLLGAGPANPIGRHGVVGGWATWRLAEVLMSALPNVAERRLDLSKRSAQAMRKSYGGDASSTLAVGGVATRGIALAIEDNIEVICASRPAPLAPVGYARLLDMELGQTAGDTSLAVEVYAATFAAAAASQTSLSFAGRGWCKRQGDGSATDRVTDAAAGISARGELLSGAGGDGGELATLCEALPHYVALTSLDLSANAMDAAAAAVLGSALEQLAAASSTLGALTLSANILGPAGAMALAPGLSSLPGLTALDVSRNYLKDDGVIALAEAIASEASRATRLAELTLDTNEVRTAGAVAVARLRSLRRLSLRDNLLKDEGAIALVAALGERGILAPRGLTSLDVQKNGIGEVGARALEAAWLESLALGVLIKNPARPVT